MVGERHYGGWWRAYDDAADNEKLQLLDPWAFKGWFNLMCLVSRGRTGVVPRIATVAFRLRISTADAERLIETLIEAGLLEFRVIEGDRCLSPKNWHERQPRRDSSRERMRKFRQRKRAVTRGDASRDANVPDSVSDSASVESSSTVAAEREGNSTSKGISTLAVTGDTGGVR